MLLSFINWQVLLMELGFDDNFLNPLRTKYLSRLTALLFPDVGGDSLDSHRAFVVKYKLGEDVDLNHHYDNAEVTINVSLGKEFSDGDLYFGDMRQVSILTMSELPTGTIPPPPPPGQRPTRTIPHQDNSPPGQFPTRTNAGQLPTWTTSPIRTTPH